MNAEKLQTINNIHWPAQKGRKFMVKDSSVIKLKKRVWGSLNLKFRSLFLKKTLAGKEKSFSDILGESNQLRKWNVLACTCRNPTGPEIGPELGLPFLFTREWNGTFANRPDFCECNLSPCRLFRTEQSGPVCNGTHSPVNEAYWDA